MKLPRFPAGSDNRRLLVAAGCSVLVHVLLVVVVPLTVEPRIPPLDTPLYISFEPLPVVDPREETLEPVEEELFVPEEPQLPREEERPAPAVDPNPLTRELAAADDPVPPRDERPAPPAVVPPADPPRTEPSRVPPPPAPEPRPAPPPPPPAPVTPAPAPREAPPAPQPEPPPVETPPAEAPPVREPQPSPPAPPPPDPPPPPPPPRAAPVRTVDRAALAAGTETATATRRLEEELQQFYQWTEEFREELAEWEADQARRADAALSEAPPPAAHQTDLERALADFIQAIRDQSTNVVSATPPGERAPGDNGPRDAMETSGVAIEGPGGRRLRVAGSAPDLRGLQLPAGFPPTYAVNVTFQVDQRGDVVVAAVVPPTPYPELDQRIASVVRSWRFQPAPAGAGTTGGSSFVSGSVTIVVETAARQER